jgi:hypothetical protein
MIKTMKDKIKILENNTNNATNNRNVNSNSTFSRLQEIQVLIKKESGLKELCMYNKYL